MLPFTKGESISPPLLQRGDRGDFLRHFGSSRVIPTDKAFA